MIYPFNSTTTEFNAYGISYKVLVDNYNPKTILGIHIQQSGIQSETHVLCGSEIIAKNYAKDYPLNLVFRYCDQPIIVDKTGVGDQAFVSLTYYEGVLTDPSETINATSGSFILNQTVSYGELLTTFFLILFTGFFIFNFIIKFIFKQKVSFRNQ